LPALVTTSSSPPGIGVAAAALGLAPVDGALLGSSDGEGVAPPEQAVTRMADAAATAISRREMCIYMLLLVPPAGGDQALASRWA
jgi:hypothetical protein